MTTNERHEFYIWAENQIKLMKRQENKEDAKNIYFKKRPIEGHPYLIGGELREKQNV
jgi:hypothetical protein